MKLFTCGDQRLNSAYGFDFLYAPQLTPQLVARALAQWPDDPETGWPSWAFENHDAPRAISRWCQPDQVDAFARLKIMLFAALRGNIIFYQGEELGLDQVDIPFDQLRDPEAIANWPLTLSRDGARTPMPWITQSEAGGFTSGAPWLPLGQANLARAVDRQEADPASLLNLTRTLLAVRRANPALRVGACTVALADQTRLVLRRTTRSQSIALLLNLSAESAAWPIEAPLGGTVLAAVNGAKLGHLPAFGALLIEESE
jgi:alpha-glucosidase